MLRQIVNCVPLHNYIFSVLFSFKQSRDSHFFFLSFHSKSIFNPSVELKHFFDSSHFCPSLNRPPEKQTKTCWEHFQNLNKLFLVKTVREKWLLTKDGVGFSCSMVQQNLIVSKVVSCVKHEKFVFFSVFQTYNSFAATYHKNLVEHLAFANDDLITYVDPTS